MGDERTIESRMIGMIYDLNAGAVAMAAAVDGATKALQEFGQSMAAAGKHMERLELLRRQMKAKLRGKNWRTIRSHG